MLLWVLFLIPISTVWSKIYPGFITKKTPPQRRQWLGMDFNTGNNFGGWLLRINNGGDGQFACCGSYYAPLLVLSSATCMEPYRYSLEGATVTTTAQLDDEEENFSLIDTVYIPDTYIKGHNLMDIAVVRLLKPLKGLLTEFIKLSNTWHTMGTLFTTFAWGYSSLGIQPPSQDPRNGTVLYEDTGACERKYPEGFISETAICAAFPYDRRKCLYDGGSPLVVNNQLYGIASTGSGCYDTSQPGIYTSVLHVKTYIYEIEQGIKSRKLP